MARLGLAAGEDARFVGDSVVLPLDRRAADAAARAGGQTVLIYQIVPRSLVTFLGRGRVAGLTYPAERGPIMCRVEDYAPFLAPEVSSAEASLPRAQLMLSLSDERFAEIFEHGTVLPELAADEAPAPYLGTYLTIRDQVLAAWDYRCAVTGQRYAPQGKAACELEVIPIRPREMGGPLHVRNCLPLTPKAADAWRRGWIAAGPGLQMLAVLDRLEPDLLEQMRPEGQLLVPANAALVPDAEHLAFHREHVFAH